MAIASSKKRKCVKGWSCGATCLSREKKNCFNGLEGEPKTLADWLEKQAKPTTETKKKEVVARATRSTAELSSLVPQNVGNSRIYMASDAIKGGALKSQDQLRSLDIQGYLNHLNAQSGKAINLAAQGSDSVSVPVGQGSVSVRKANLRLFAAQANRDARRIWRAADEQTKDSWAQELQGDGNQNGRNRFARNMSKDLNNRFNRIQEQEAIAKKAARNASRGKS